MERSVFVARDVLAPRISENASSRHFVNKGKMKGRGCYYAPAQVYSLCVWVFGGFVAAVGGGAEGTSAGRIIGPLVVGPRPTSLIRSRSLVRFHVV
jgi:hypothetical protein